jgi:hypothetical protein
MNYALLAVAAIGVQWGYRTVDDGSIEYTIQLRPEEARQLVSSGEEILSYIPAEVQPVGRIRIVVGSEPLPRGPHLRQTQLRTARPADPNKDLAGRLVAVQPAAAQNTSGSGGSLQLRAPDGTRPNVSDVPPPNGGNPDDTGQVAASQGTPLPRDELRQPVYLVGDPQKDAAGLPPVGANEQSVQPTAAAGESPSDLSAGQLPGNRADEAQLDDTQDRPWLPLVAVAAVAAGFLAGNVFQWRTYVALRKRYLHLLRKTGG